MSSMGTPSVAVAFVHGSHDVAIFHTCLRNMLDHDREHGHHIADVIDFESSPRIAAGRNRLVSEFLELGHDVMLMLDTDMLMPRDLVQRLLKHFDPVERPIISGLYFGGRLHGKQNAHIYRLTPEGTGLDSIEGLTGPGEWGGLVPVHAAGAGCLMMGRQCLERIGTEYSDSGFPWFVEGRGAVGGDQGRDIGEDIAFCLRALNLGLPIHADTSTILGHAKVGVIDERSHAAYLTERELLGEEGVKKELLKTLRLVSQSPEGVV